VIPRTKDPLQVKQRLMRARQRVQPKLGRPKKEPADPQLSKRIAAIILLQEGQTVALTSYRVGTTVARLQAWIDRGMPLVGDYPERGLKLD
jgi:hypothetical protein